MQTNASESSLYFFDLDEANTSYQNGSYGNFRTLHEVKILMFFFSKIDQNGKNNSPDVNNKINELSTCNCMLVFAINKLGKTVLLFRDSCNLFVMI